MIYIGKDSIIMPFSKPNYCQVQEYVKSKSVALGVEINTGQTSDQSVTRAYFNQDSNKVDLLVMQEKTDGKKYDKLTEINIIKTGKKTEKTDTKMKGRYFIHVLRYLTSIWSAC